MNPGYGEVFARRGNSYDDAMRLCPGARGLEFRELFAPSGVQAGQRVLDFPAGGGYLRGFLPAGVDVCSLELSAGFGAGIPVHDPAQAWPYGRFDHAVCLASLHHIDEQRDFLGAVMQRLVPGGTLHMADVPVDSSIARFLDDFVGRYNVTGHHGHYPPPDAAFFAPLGAIARLEEAPCPWYFDDEAHMLAFCTLLFGLLDCPPERLRKALAERVGFERDGNRLRLNWRLLYVDILKSP